MIIGLSKSCGFHAIYNHFDRENDEQSLEPGWLAEACSTIKICWKEGCDLSNYWMLNWEGFLLFLPAWNGGLQKIGYQQRMI